MRPTSWLALSLLLAVTVSAPALAYDPDDVPWDDNNSYQRPVDPEDNGSGAPGSDDFTDPESGDAAGIPRGGNGAASEPEAPSDTAEQPDLAPSQSTAGSQAITPAPDATIAATPFPLPVKSYLQNAAAALKAFPPEDQNALFAFYDGRQENALWVDKSGYTAAAIALRAELAKANDWGLDAKIFTTPELSDTSGLTEESLTAADVQLSLAAMLYARHARGGRIDNPTEKLSSYLDRTPQLLPAATVIDGLAKAPEKSAYLRRLNPQHPQFERLRQKLLELRNAAAKEEVVKIPDTGPATKPGQSHEQIALIRERLKVPAPTTRPDGKAADASFYDAALADAVKGFKEQEGIRPFTATITNRLRRALNSGTPIITEDLLLANMEQWRWMPEDLGSTFIAVNVPEFHVRVVKDGAVIHDERVITGRIQTQTPIFSDQMRTVVFQPVWNVPDSIKVNELLPKLRAGYDPIARQGLAIKRNGRSVGAWNVDWYASDIRNYHIYQPPGPRNVLGVVKFLFPNKHAVYLHDTPTKNLFNQSVRTYSHGCMRVRNPVRLAEVLLAEDKGWSSDRVHQLIARGPENNDVALDKPIPVHVTYFTAWVAKDGTLKTFADVYGHQKRITLALAGRWNEIDKNRDHLLPVRSAPVARAPYGWDEYADNGPYGRRGRNGQPYQKKQPQSVGDFIQQVFGGGF